MENKNIEALEYIRNHAVWTFASIHGMNKVDPKLIESFNQIENELVVLNTLKRNVFETKQEEKDQSSYIIDYNLFNEDDKYITHDWFEEK